MGTNFDTIRSINVSRRPWFASTRGIVTRNSMPSLLPVSVKNVGEREQLAQKGHEYIIDNYTIESPDIVNTYKKVYEMEGVIDE